ncbi:MAG: DUF2147 domain-containing protein [Prevotellaceae bacterium]|jgi:uncharacterized protein (DUF2147 family)|nr:DUF2147 domain-containing protein [Prevotellaceae bacterium]
MQKIRTSLLLTLVALAGYGLPTAAQAQIDSVAGFWKTVDDKTGEVRAIVHIYQADDGLYYGKIHAMLRYADARCLRCDGDDKGKPLQGLVIIRDMKPDRDVLKGGRVLDPETGKQYYCSIRLDPQTGRLVLRGSLDKRGLLGRNQYWIR